MGRDHILAAGARARANYTDQDIIDFLVNVECLEGEFDTWGTFGRGFTGNLGLGGPQPIGVCAAFAILLMLVLYKSQCD